MKSLISTFLLVFTLSATAQFSFQARQSGNYTFDNCTRTSEQFDHNLNVSSFIFDCPTTPQSKHTVTVLLTKNTIRIQTPGSPQITDDNCFIDELINGNGTWEMTVECDDPQPTITLEWTNCTLLGTESGRLNPKVRILHCEDLTPPNDDYYIWLTNTTLKVDDGNSELREYFGCDINYLDTLNQTYTVDVAFKTTCWND